MRVIAQTQHYVVVDKPPGLLSVPGKGEHKADCVVARVRALCAHAQGPMVVHRLDMDTSGLMVVALTASAQRELSQQFERREVSKAYVAVLDGIVESEEGLIDVPIRADIDNRPRQIVDFIFGKPSRTRYRVLSRGEGRTRIRMEPITGRSHQLRVHAMARRQLLRPDGVEVPGGLGCPIVGDVLYADPKSPGAYAARLMLHASELEIGDPGTGLRVRFSSLPEF